MGPKAESSVRFFRVWHPLRPSRLGVGRGQSQRDAYPNGEARIDTLIRDQKKEVEVGSKGAANPMLNHVSGACLR